MATVSWVHHFEKLPHDVKGENPPNEWVLVRVSLSTNAQMVPTPQNKSNPQVAMNVPIPNWLVDKHPSTRMSTPRVSHETSYPTHLGVSFCTADSVKGKLTGNKGHANVGCVILSRDAAKLVVVLYWFPLETTIKRGTLKNWLLWTPLQKV